MAEGTAAPVAPAKPAAPADPKLGAPAAPAAPAAKTEEATETIKVNGKEVKVTPSQLRALAQKGYFADQRLKSVDVVTGKTKALLDQLKTPEGLISLLKDPALGNSPKEVLKKLLASDVVDDELKDFAAKWVYENVVKKDKMTPEEIEREKKLTDYERLKKQEEDRKKEELTKQQQAKIQEIYTTVRAEVSKQITADKTFPQTEGTIRSVFQTLKAMNKQGAPINAESISRAIVKVKKDHVLHQQAMFDALEDPEALIALFGEARALKISKALVARLQNKAKPKVEAKPEGEATIKTTERIDKKLGRERHGYQVMDV